MEKSIIIALSCYFIIALANKFMLIELVAINTPYRFIAKLFNCQFCISFWLNYIATTTYALITFDFYSLLLIPVSTVITFKLWN